MKFNADKNKGTKKEYGKFKKILTDKKGVTLIELVVTFALISLFVVLASQAIASAMRVYSHIQGINMGRQVSDTLMDKITGQISGAQAMVNKQETSVIISTEANRKTENGTASYTPVGEGESGTLVDFYNQGKSHVTIKTEQIKNKASNQRQLVIYYYPVRAYEEVDWKFDQKMYMGYSIKELKFAWADKSEYPENVMKVDLTITGKYGDYAATRYVECYNLDNGDSSTEPPSGGGSVPDPPVDPTPPVDPEPPVDPDDEGDGFIYIHHNKDEVLHVKAAKNPYNDLYEESGNANTFTFPAGIYKAKDTYYFFPNKVEINKNDYKPNQFYEYCDNNSRTTCYLVLDNGKVYTEDDALNDWNWKSGRKPSRGNLYFYKERYYLCNDEWASPNPVNNTYAWVDVTGYVAIKNEK